LTKEHSRQNAETYKALFLLIAALFRSPNDDFKDDVESGRLQSVVDYLSDLAGLEPSQINPPNWQDLQVTYVQLFLTNPSGIPAPPYLAYAIDNEIYGKSYKELKEFYTQNDLIVKDDYLDLPDHLAAVAEACLLLLSEEKLGAVTELSKKYFLPWFEKYSSEINEIDKVFYGPLSVLCQELLRRLTNEA